MKTFLQQNVPFSKAVSTVGTVTLIAAAAALPACSNPEVSETPPDGGEVAATPGNNVETEELTENLSNYIGQTVTVRQEAEELVGESAFFVEADELFGGEEVLVINASGQGLYLVEGDDTEVQVIGEVRELITVDVAQEYDLDLDPNLFADYEQQPVIVAQSIALAPDPEEINDNPEAYYDQRIVVEGEIEDVWSSDLMTIEGGALFGGDELLVINPSGTTTFQEDEEVAVTGVLRPLVISEVEQEYDLTWDLDIQREIETEYQDEPVFIADEVYPKAM